MEFRSVPVRTLANHAIGGPHLGKRESKGTGQFEDDPSIEMAGLKALVTAWNLLC